MLSLLAIHDQHLANISRQMLLDGIDVGLPNWYVCRRGLNQSVHEGINNISNVTIHID